MASEGRRGMKEGGSRTEESLPRIPKWRKIGKWTEKPLFPVLSALQPDSRKDERAQASHVSPPFKYVVIAG